MWIKDGLFGFVKWSESLYDVFGVGYFLMLIFVVLGFVVVCDLGGVIFEGVGDVIVVIGDGLMSVGMVFEVMNNVGYLGKCLIVILNDNEMLIVEFVGVLLIYLFCFYVEVLF